MKIEDLKLEEYLKTVNCKGCFQHCPLSAPNCGRSKISINEALEAFNDKRNR